ncbi:MAG: hypothetical protein HUK40_07260 [Desulfobacter sp.]|nr:hypothetical protein [Desulfobacter sp.]WDP84207.1 MAG: hypothetical protein HUN05_02720 [Desulfobacter sp.]
MFRKMRRKDKKISGQEVIDILNSGKEGVLATMGQDGYPGSVAKNY